MYKIKKKLTKLRRRQDDQDFLLSVTVYQAKELHVQHLKSFVEVSFGGKVKTTRVANSSSNPHFNEYMVFEVRCTLRKFLRRSVTFRLYHEACFRRCTGELVVDLETVWNAEGRSFSGTWGRLVSCSGVKGERSDSCGLLQFDLVIHADNTKAPNQFDHQSSQVLELDGQKILLNFNLYCGAFPTVRDYCVRVSLCGVEVCSQIAKITNNPEWNQQFQFMWFFPALCSSFEIKIECPSTIHAKIICREKISLRNLSFVTNGKNTLPSYGPAWWYFYKNEEYLGRILFSIQATPLGDEMPFNRSVKINGINKFFENDFWPTVRFTINLAFLKLDFLHAPSRHINLQMKCMDESSTPFDLLCTQYSNSNLYFLNLTQKYPTFSMDLILPDLRHILRDEILLKNLLSKFQRKLESINDQEVSGENLEEFLEDMENALRTLMKILSNGDNGETIMQWHVYFRTFALNCLIKLVDELNEFKESGEKFSSFGSFMKNFLHKLKHISSLGITKWPKLFIKLLDDQGRDFGKHSIDLKDIVSLNDNHGEAFLCRRRHSVLFKSPQCSHEDQQCGCIAGHGELILWMGKDTIEWWPKGWAQSTLSHFNFIECPTKSALKCRIYLYQAKIEQELNRTSLHGTFVDIFFNVHHIKSTILRQNLIPNWNEVVSFENILLDYDAKTYMEDPPMIFFKLYEGGKHRHELLGIGYTSPRIILRDMPKVQGKWKWIPIMRNGITMAQLLVNIDLEEVAEENGAEVVNVRTPLPKEIDIQTKKFHIFFTCYGLRLMEKSPKKGSELSLEFTNMTLSMGPCTNISGRTCSFRECFKYVQVDLPENPYYWPPIIIKHRRENSSKLIGLTIISDAQQFYEKTSLSLRKKKNSVKREKIQKVKEHLSISMNEKIEDKGSNFTKSLIESTKTMILGRDGETIPKEEDIERGILLKTEEESEVPIKLTWWSKFFNSLSEENHDEKVHKLKIYETELENQLEFEQLRDWADIYEMFRTRKGTTDTTKRQKYCILRGQIEILNDTDATQLADKINK